MTVRSSLLGLMMPILSFAAISMSANAARPPAFAVVRPPTSTVGHVPARAAGHERIAPATQSQAAGAAHRPIAGVLVPPVNPACVSSPFGPRVLANLPQAGTFHYGIDLPAFEGAPVHAIAAGQVIRVQRKGPGGLELLIQHDGFVGVYSHLGMVTPAIAEGQRAILAGQKIGVVGHTGLMLGYHLYFGMIVDGRPIDPTPYLGVHPCSGHTAARVGPADGKLPPSKAYAGR